MIKPDHPPSWPMVSDGLFCLFRVLPENIRKISVTDESHAPPPSPPQEQERGAIVRRLWRICSLPLRRGGPSLDCSLPLRRGGLGRGASPSGRTVGRRP